MNQRAGSILMDQMAGERTASLDLLWIVGFSLLTALAAQIEIRAPFMPVPWTGQTFGVLLSGAVLGSRRGFASQLLYLAEGAAGLPVFAGGAFSIVHLLGPTGGYLWSYPIAAALAGLLVEKGASRAVGRLAAALCLADALILVAGSAWLRAFFGYSFEQAAMLGIYPFIAGDLVKIAMVGVAVPKVLKRYEHGAPS
jgi:biotin transport system substrate-specific component